MALQLDTRRPIDLLLVLAGLPLFFLAAWLDGPAWLRAPIGLPFLLLAPGYALVAMLYPEGVSDAKRASHAGTPERGGAPKELQPERSLFPAERIALSVAASVVVAAAVGLALHLGSGVTARGVAVGVTATTLVLAAVALVVRLVDVPPERRPRFAWAGLRRPALDRGADKAMAAVLALSLLLLVGTLVYTLPALREQAGYTSLWLAPNEAPECYPLQHAGGNAYRHQNATGCPAGLFSNVTVNLANHRGEEASYRVVVHWAAQGSLSGGGLGRVVLQFEATLPDSGGKGELEPQLSRPVQLGPPPFSGRQHLVVDLYVADGGAFGTVPDQSLQLRVDA